MSLSITLIIIIGTVIASISAFNDRSLHERLLYSPYESVRGEWYRMISHAFVHADYMHLFINMFVLYMFGDLIETTLIVNFDGTGKTLFLTLYLGGVLFAAIPGLVKHRDNPAYRSHGASGAVSAVLFAFVMLYPEQRIMLLFPPIPMPAFVFGIGYLILEYVLDKRGGGRVAHDAHFWGALFGILFTIVVFPESPERLWDAVSSLFG